MWNIICKKIKYVFLLSLTEALKPVVRFFLKDAEFFLQRYPLLSKDSGDSWHSFYLNIGELIAYSLAKRPLFIKLALFFTMTICSAIISLGALISFLQAQTLQEQATQFNKALTTQAAYVLETPLLLNNKEAITTIVMNLMRETTTASITIYASDYSVIKTYGTNGYKAVFPKNAIEYTQQNPDELEIVNNMLGKVKQMNRYTIPIQYNALVIGYLSVAFNYSDLENIRVQTLEIIFLITCIAFLIAITAAFYISSLLFKPFNELLAASESIHKINFGEDKHNPKNLFDRKDELEVLMDSMNHLNKGLLQKDKVEAFFSRYVSAQVANQVLKDLDNIESVKLGGEHVMASVFFADIVGFTSLSEALQPQEISSLLNEYFSKIIEAVTFCNGRVDKFIGDCAMVVFGVPEKNPHHAFNCVACAWMILQLIAKYNDKREAEGAVTVEFRIGANSGMMLAGNMGSTERMEYTVVGDSVNLASRLSGTGEPGQLIITEDVFIEQGLESSVLTEVKDLIKIRGKTLPVKILNVKDILHPFKEQMLNELPRIIAGETKHHS